MRLQKTSTRLLNESDGIGESRAYDIPGDRDKICIAADRLHNNHRHHIWSNSVHPRSWHDGTRSDALVMGLFYFIFYIGCYTYLEGSRGQTIGKMITKNE